MTTFTERAIDAERADLLDSLDKHRALLLRTVDGLTDEQAARRTTVSELCLGGIVKHLTLVEEGWVDFIVAGPPADEPFGEATLAAHAAGFRVREGDTLAGLCARYDEAAQRTDELVASLPSLDASQPLPEAPWFAPGARWTARRVIVHLIAETAQHAGHADILREAIDGAKTMG